MKKKKAKKFMRKWTVAAATEDVAELTNDQAFVLGVDPAAAAESTNSTDGLAEVLSSHPSRKDASAWGSGRAFDKKGAHPFPGRFNGCSFSGDKEFYIFGGGLGVKAVTDELWKYTLGHTGSG